MLTVVHATLTLLTIVAVFCNWKISQAISRGLALERAYLRELAKDPEKPEAQSRDFVPNHFESN